MKELNIGNAIALPEQSMYYGILLIGDETSAKLKVLDYLSQHLIEAYQTDDTLKWGGILIDCPKEIQVTLKNKLIESGRETDIIDGVLLNELKELGVLLRQGKIIMLNTEFTTKKAMALIKDEFYKFTRSREMEGPEIPKRLILNFNYNADLALTEKDHNDMVTHSHSRLCNVMNIKKLYKENGNFLIQKLQCLFFTWIAFPSSNIKIKRMQNKIVKDIPIKSRNLDRSNYNCNITHFSNNEWGTSRRTSRILI